MQSSNVKMTSWIGLILLALLFLIVNMLSTHLFQGKRIDLTENQLYTFSQGTRNIVAAIEEPITLNYFFSNQATQQIAPLRAYAVRVQELLEEYAQISNGMIALNVIDPVPYSEEEDQASEFGLQGVPLQDGGETLYFGLAGSNSVGDVEIIPFFQPNKEQFLEYDISKLIYTLANPEKSVVGVMSGLPMFSSFDMRTQRIEDPWVITNQIQQLFDIRKIETSATTLDEDLDVLILVHPKELSAATRYAIDQFVMNGGNLMVFVDPYSEADVPPPDPNSPLEKKGVRASDLPDLFRQWGIIYDKTKVVGDRLYAMEVQDGETQQPVRHYAILALTGDSFDKENIATAGLDLLTMAIAGHLGADTNIVTEYEPLIFSSDQAKLFDSSQFAFMPKISALAEDYRPTGDKYTLAARYKLKPKTAFPDGPPPQPENTKEEDEEPAAAAKEKPAAKHLVEPKQPVNIIVVADTDLLTNRLWVQVQDFLGQQIVDAWASNGDFVINAIDNMLGSSDLISIRGRATATRPFEVVENLRREAEDQFREQEQLLQQKLMRTEQRLAELESKRDDDSALLMTPEQSAEIERFQREKLQVRKELRQVRHKLDQNIESLGTQLKVLNVVAVPVVITVIALIISFIRLRKRKQKFYR